MKLFLATLALWGMSSFAASDVNCNGFVYNDKTDKFTQGNLTQASYDPAFLEANVLNYGLGADKFFLKDGNLTLVIVDHKTHASAASTAGWKKINNTLMQETNLFVTLPDGSRDQIQVSCYQEL